MSRQFYLGKAGQSFGPYTEQQYDEMRESGELKEYGCFWDTTQPGWQILNCPPAPYAVEEERVATPQVYAPPPAQAAPATSRLIASRSSVEAVCHDHKNLIGGELVSITDYGCELLTRHPGKDRCFADQAFVILNVFDPKSGRSIDIPAQLLSVAHKNGSWIYQLKWNHCPDLVRKNAVAAA